MSKKIAMSAATIALMFALVGCSSCSASNSTSASSAAASASSSYYAASSAGNSSSLFKININGWVENEVTAGVPVPKFSVEPSSVHIDKSYVTLRYSGVPENEVTSYVEAAKEAGFTHNDNESKASTTYSYSAYNGENTSDSSRIHIYYDSSNKGLEITVMNGQLV